MGVYCSHCCYFLVRLLMLFDPFHSIGYKLPIKPVWGTSYFPERDLLTSAREAIGGTCGPRGPASHTSYI